MIILWVEKGLVQNITASSNNYNASIIQLLTIIYLCATWGNNGLKEDFKTLDPCSLFIHGKNAGSLDSRSNKTACFYQTQHAYIQNSTLFPKIVALGPINLAVLGIVSQLAPSFFPGMLLLQLLSYIQIRYFCNWHTEQNINIYIYIAFTIQKLEQFSLRGPGVNIEFMLYRSYNFGIDTYLLTPISNDCIKNVTFNVHYLFLKAKSNEVNITIDISFNIVIRE